MSIDLNAGESLAAAPDRAPDEPGALWLPSPHFWPDANRPRYVIVHGTGYTLSQTAADVAHDFATTNPNSTHYAVDRAGAIAQMVRERDAAWGNGVISAGADPWWSDNPNRYTISIEHVNDSQNATPLSPAQQAASFALIADICRRNGIPPRPADAAGGVTGHYSIDPVNRAYCPGAYPWQALWAYLRAHSLRQLPRPESMSEFQGYFGDCTQTAHLACLNNIDPVRWPFTAAELDTLVRSDIAHGWAEPSGAQSLGNLANSIRNEGLHFHQITDGSWVQALDTWGGVKPIMLGFDLGGRLPGDEPGVQGHAIACVAWDAVAHTGLFCDGDNKAANAPVRYTLAQLQAAALTSMTVFDIVPPGGTLMAPNPPVANLGAGFTDYVAAHGIIAPLVTPGEVATGDPRYPGEAFAAFADGTILYYTRAFGVRADRGPWLVLELWQDLQAERAANAKLQQQADAAAAQLAQAQQQLAALRPQPAPAQAPVSNPAPSVAPAPAAPATAPVALADPISAASAASTAAIRALAAALAGVAAR